MHTQFRTANLADELDLLVAPFFVDDSRARRFVSDGRSPTETRPTGDAGGGAADRRPGPEAMRAVGADRHRLRQGDRWTKHCLSQRYGPR